MHVKTISQDIYKPPRFNTMIHYWNHETMGEGGLSKEENAISIYTYISTIAKHLFKAINYILLITSKYTYTAHNINASSRLSK